MKWKERKKEKICIKRILLEAFEAVTPHIYIHNNENAEGRYMVDIIAMILTMFN